MAKNDHILVKKSFSAKKSANNGSMKLDEASLKLTEGPRNRSGGSQN